MKDYEAQIIVWGHEMKEKKITLSLIDCEAQERGIVEYREVDQPQRQKL